MELPCDAKQSIGNSWMRERERAGIYPCDRARCERGFSRGKATLKSGPSSNSNIGSASHRRVFVSFSHKGRSKRGCSFISKHIPPPTREEEVKAPFMPLFFRTSLLVRTDPLDIRTDGGQLVFEQFEAPVEVVDPVHFSLPVGHQPRNHK